MSSPGQPGDDVPAVAPADGEPPSADPPGAVSRRRFLKVATCAVGGGVGAAVAVPAIGYLLYPVGRGIITASDEPIDATSLDRLVVGGPPLRVALTASTQRDAWTTIRDVPLGAAWLRRIADRQVEALSSICPHLGCAVAWDGNRRLFKCPCHESAFAPDGSRLDGPAERGLDPLPVALDGDRIKITWVRYRPGGGDRKPL